MKKDKELEVVSDEVLGPEVTKGGEETTNNLVLSPESMLSEKQLLHLLQRTPRSHIYTRPGRGGQTFEYVTGVYVKKVLNYVFGWRWDFEVVGEQVIGNQIVIKGKLTVHGEKEGQTIIKTQYGRADIKYKKDTKDAVDIGNDFKAAATDCLKKCASELGIASDIYGREEFRDIKAQQAEEDVEMIDEETAQVVVQTLEEKNISLEKFLKKHGKDSVMELTQKQGQKILTQIGV